MGVFKKKQLEAQEAVDQLEGLTKEEAEGIQTEFNVDSIEDLNEDGEVENVYKEN